MKSSNLLLILITSLLINNLAIAGPLLPCPEANAFANTGIIQSKSVYEPGPEGATGWSETSRTVIIHGVRWIASVGGIQELDNAMGNKKAQLDAINFFNQAAGEASSSSPYHNHTYCTYSQYGLYVAHSLG